MFARSGETCGKAFSSMTKREPEAVGAMPSIRMLADCTAAHPDCLSRPSKSVENVLIDTFLLVSSEAIFLDSAELTLHVGFEALQ